jgi:hypothetical protein
MNRGVYSGNIPSLWGEK